MRKTVGETILTPYGAGIIERVNPCYGYKVRLKKDSYWFAFWEVGEAAA